MVGGLLMPQAQLKEQASAKWQTARPFLLLSAGMLFSIPIALLPFAIRRVQPTAEFLFLVAVPGVWNCLCGWITPPCLYVVLNLVIVTLGVKSGALSLTSGQTESYGYTPVKLAPDQTSEAKVYYSQCSIAANYELKVAFAAEIQKLPAASVPEHDSPTAKCSSPVPRELTSMQSGSGSLGNSSTKLLNPASGGEFCGQIVECAASESSAAENYEERPSATHLVVFDICAEQIVEDLTEDQEEPDLSAEELFVKAENFIQNFKCQLKMQREDSWRRLHGIYKQSC